MTVTVHCWVDPSCPYSRLTSRWLVEAAAVRPLELRWHILSLAVLNEHRDDDPEGDPEGYLWGPVRVAAAVNDRHGQAGLARFLDSYGTLVTGRGAWTGFETVLAAADLPAELAADAWTHRWDDAVRASHAEGIALVGDHVGTPIVSTVDPVAGRVSFFGPVISQVPVGEAAGRLWDGTVLVAGTPGFHELKGQPPAAPAFD